MIKQYVYFGLVLLVCVAFTSTAQARITEDGMGYESGSYQLQLKDIEGAVSAALESMGIAEHLQTRVTSTRKSVIYRHSKPLRVEIRTLKHDEKKSSWSASLFIMDGEEVLSAIPVTGRYEEMVMVPILSERISRGHIIEAADLEEMLYPARKLRQDSALSTEEVIGKTPERTISKGRPLRLGELQAPHILKKGASVHMRYKTPSMLISTMGEALESGAKGDMVRIRNHDSGISVQARILSKDEVEVGKYPIR